jgi:hypothetical protein
MFINWNVFFVLKQMKLYSTVITGPQDDQINKNNIGGTWSTHGKDEKYIQNFSGETWREETI